MSSVFEDMKTLCRRFCQEEYDKVRASHDNARGTSGDLKVNEGQTDGSEEEEEEEEEEEKE